ncbi:Baeyer-Villiger flavin-containing monooxygenase [Meiothermus luteus]|jgi:thioredoxin reductase|uniref:Baeyer-Villiger flavin-containing monooxygenase n=2 Tax=Meiothermus luteus TaxID=2026184 RepID=A0A399EJN7_9DEIN|nr:Baeyer-Villiger flavin-containing monooxygenase [Meiothermus luteus]
MGAFLSNMERTDVLIVGAGPAGIGVGLALQKLGVQFHILERYGVGASFRRWPKETRFITPSFTANAFGLPDLNAITPDTSPAYSLGKERLSGPDYARYLKALVGHYHLPVLSKTGVQRVEVLPEGFRVESSRGVLETRFLIWATGEFQFPHRPFRLGLHYGQVRSWAGLAGKRFVVVGGYESGLDAACNLAALGKEVWVFDPEAPWERASGEPSLDLSPYTHERLARALSTRRIHLVKAGVEAIRREGQGYRLYLSQGELRISSAPILATGFEGGFAPVRELFHWEGATPLLKEESDESTRTPGLFLVGPKVNHRGTAFCFIYKFRARFPVVAQAIAERLGVDPGPLEVYRKRGMWADDLAACCTSRCAC